MLGIITSSYKNVKSCVKYNGVLSDYFSINKGLLQGEVMSPILFSFYLNDFEITFINDNCKSVEIQDINLFLLLFADDLVLFSETPEGLQQMLNSLYSYTKKWNLKVNVEKTKIVIFRNGGNVKQDETWYYDEIQIDITNEFKYLGMLFYFNGKFLKTQKHVSEQGRKAYFALLSTVKKYCFNIETNCEIFDTYVHSILSYASEVWGFHKGQSIEKVHLDFCKNLLGVSKNVCNDLVYCELGRFPLILKRKLKIFKYWLKVRESENCILKSCYDERCELNDTWIISIKNELRQLGLEYLWESQVIPHCTFKIFEQRLYDVTKQNMIAHISNSSKGFLYQHLIDNITIQFYLRKSIENKFTKFITRFRISAHNLGIEKGRHRNLERRNRLCNICDKGVIEDEFHFILTCPLYNNLRIKYIKSYYYRRPSMFKLVQLLSVQNVKILCNLGKYLYYATKLREIVTPKRSLSRT